MNLPENPTPDQLADFYWHRASMPGAVWLALMLAACLDVTLAPAAQTSSHPDGPGLYAYAPGDP